MTPPDDALRWCTPAAVLIYCGWLALLKILRKKSKSKLIAAFSISLSIASLSILVATGGDARAGDVARARKVFAEGVRLYQAGDWEGARRLFRDAEAEHHAPAIVYNIGLAEEKLGHPQAAVDAYEAYIAETGDKGDLGSSAAAAIAQIKSRSTRLRIESKPTGARVFLDGVVLAEAAPTNVLVAAGHHIIVAQGEGWRGERDVEVRGGGDVVPVMLEASPSEGSKDPGNVTVGPGPMALPPVPRSTSPEYPGGGTQPAPTTPAGEGVPDGFAWGASFAIVPAYLLGVRNQAATNKTAALSIVAGPLLEIGYALTDRFEFLARGIIGIGPDAKPSYAYMGGPGLSYRIGSTLWVGATFIGGQLETKAHDARYGTDKVFGAMLETNFILLKKPGGEWLAGIQPSLLLTEMRQDNTTFFFPLSFGYRSY